MPTIRVNKISSVVYRLGLKPTVELTEDTQAQVGNVVVARILSDKRVYNDLELVNGRMSKIAKGNVIVGALGKRRALQGFVGDVPPAVRVGDVLHLLNMGGVIGLSNAVHKDLGHPAALEVLGMAVRDGTILNLKHSVLAARQSLAGLEVPPVVLVSGSCMNSGKTSACAQVIQELAKAGVVVHGGKLTGVACRRDSIAMEDHGAARTASFLDAGYPSTVGLGAEEMVAMARTVIASLLEGDPEAIILELGDGIIGDYGVMPILEDEEIRACVKVHIFCAGDMVGAWGGMRFLAERGVPLDVMAGPATDSPVGIEYIERQLGVPAVNARLDPLGLAQVVLGKLGLEKRKER